MQILMVRGIPVQVSDEDFEWASQWRWQWNGGQGNDYVFRVGYRDGHHLGIVLHKEIWARMGRMVPDGYTIDHKDRDKCNNQRDNLRVLTRSANNANNAAKGYSWHKRDKRWVAKIYKNGITHRLGRFKTREEAGAAYEEAKRRLYPELYE